MVISHGPRCSALEAPIPPSTHSIAQLVRLATYLRDAGPLPPPRRYRAVQPMSIVTGTPVNARPAGPARNATTSATSSGSISSLMA
jgi:hypothetical protein